MNDEYTIELDLDQDEVHVGEVAMHASSRSLYMLYMGVCPYNGYATYRFRGTAQNLLSLMDYYGYDDDLQTYIVD